MHKYLLAADKIQRWLAGLQIPNGMLQADISGQNYTFEFSHPMSGRTSVFVPMDTEGIFVEKGIAFRMSEKYPDKAYIEIYDGGGIFDPVDGRVQGEHYSTSHFALLSAILFNNTGEQKYLAAAKKAIAFHIRTSPSEYQPMSEWMYHWDFQNYAFALTYRLLQAHLAADEDQKWLQSITSWTTNSKNKLTNWAAMRAWAYTERQQHKSSLIDRLLVVWNLHTIARARSADGCFDDNPGLSRPIQYHIFTVAILHRLLRFSDDNRLRDWFIRGVDYFLPFIDPEGAFNYIGRGHEQIFGYGSAIYALEAAAAETGESRYGAAAAQLFDYLKQFEGEQCYPLVLNRQPDELRSGWYDYHHLTVYNAFLGVWLALAADVADGESISAEQQYDTFWYSEPTQTAIIRKENYFAAFYGGLSEYLSEPGISPHHIWWRDMGCVFSCPGGPTPERFGQRSPETHELNLFAPVARNCTAWYTPSHKSSQTFSADKEGVVMKFDYGPFAVHRRVDFKEEGMFFKDRIEFTQDVDLEEFRFFNLPVPLDYYDVEVKSDDELLIRHGTNALSVRINGVEAPLKLTDKLLTPKGRVQTACKCQQSFRAGRGECIEIEFSVRMNGNAE